MIRFGRQALRVSTTLQRGELQQATQTISSLTTQIDLHSAHKEDRSAKKCPFSKSKLAEGNCTKTADKIKCGNLQK